MSRIKINKSICEPFGEIVDEAFVHFNKDTRGLDIYGEQENEEIRNDFLESNNNEEDEDEQIYHGGAPLQPVQPIISDEELNNRIRSLNKKQRNIFNFVMKWTRETIQSRTCENVLKTEPFQIFLTGSAGCGKSHLLTTIKFYLQKSLTYGSKDIGKERLLMLAPTGVAAVNVDGSTIHSTLGILTDYSSGKCVSKLSDKRRSSLREKLSEVKVIIIDEISMVSNKLLMYIHQRLSEIFGTTNNALFAGISIITCGDFYQLPPIQQKPVYAEFNDPMLNIDHCWRYFKIAELTEVMRQRGDQTLIALLNNIRQGILTDEDRQILESRFIAPENPNYPFEAVHIFAENSLVNSHNQQKLDELPGNKIELIAIDKLPSNITDAVLDKIYQRSQMDTGGLAYKLALKLNAKVMITTNINVEDKLCNGQIGVVRYIKYDRNENIQKIYLQMEEPEVGIKMMQTDNYARIHKLVPIERVEKEIKIKKNKPSSPIIKRLQFPLILSWACTVHKVQGKTFPKIVFSFQLLKQRRFNSGQVYVALSRVTSLEGLYLTGQFNKNSITFDQRAYNEYEYMRNNLKLVTGIDSVSCEENSLTFSLLNIRSLKKHSVDIKYDQSLMKSNIIFLTETQLTSESDLSSIVNHLPRFSFQFNSADNHRFSSLASACDEDVQITTLENIDGASLYSISHRIFETPINVILIYRQNRMKQEDFLYLLQHLQGLVDNVHIILGDFNVDYLKTNSEFLRNYLDNYKMIVEMPTHISGSLIDHIYIDKNFNEKFKIRSQRRSVYFSDHDAIIVNILT